MTNLSLCALQLCVLAATSIGFGELLRRLAPDAVRNSAFARLASAIAGFCLNEVLLQNLVYLDLPVRYGAWISFAMAAICLAYAGLGRFRSSARATDRVFGEAVSASPRRNSDLTVASALLFLVAFYHLIPAIHAGPENYYGRGHIDQVNYVLLGQFLLDVPFSASVDQIGAHPWLLKAIDLKAQRIGQSIPNAYLAAITLSDVKTTYAATQSFYLGMAAMATYMLGRAFRVSRPLASLAALFAGFAPALTNLALDGFLSQASILFLAPLIAAHLRQFRAWPSSFLLLAPSLAFGLTSYPEFFPVVALWHVALLAANCVSLPRASRRTFAVGTGVLLLSLFLVPAYLGPAADFARRQYGVAAAQNVLALLRPDAGTLLGWARIFFGYPTAERPGEAIAAPILVLLIAISATIAANAFFSKQPARRVAIAAMAGMPIAMLIALSAKADFPKYAFGKIAETFVPIWVVLVALGLARSSALIRGGVLDWRWPTLTSKPRANGARWTRMRAGAKYLGAKYLVTLPLVACMLLALGGSTGQFNAIFKRREILEIVDSDSARAVYRRLDGLHGATVWIWEPHNIASAWLAYHARDDLVYLKFPTLADLSLKGRGYAFQAVPARLEGTYVVSASALLHAELDGPAPLLSVDNPQGIEYEAHGGRWYWIGKTCTLEILAFPAIDHAEEYELDFRLVAGLANPEPGRIVELVLPDGSESRIEFSGSKLVRVPLKLRRGDNLVKINVVAPVEQLVKVPGDGRIHMLELHDVALLERPSPAKQ
jgi:hypothetical protein